MAMVIFLYSLEMSEKITNTEMLQLLKHSLISFNSLHDDPAFLLHSAISAIPSFYAFRLA